MSLYSMIFLITCYFRALHPSQMRRQGRKRSVLSSLRRSFFLQAINSKVSYIKVPPTSIVVYINHRVQLIVSQIARDYGLLKISIRDRKKVQDNRRITEAWRNRVARNFIRGAPCPFLSVERIFPRLKAFAETTAASRGGEEGKARRAFQYS